MMQEINTGNLVRKLNPTENVISSIKKRIRSLPVKKLDIPPIRDKVFNEELKTLASVIIKHEKTTDSTFAEPFTKEIIINPELISRLDKLMKGVPILLPDYAGKSFAYIFNNYSFNSDFLDPVFRYMLRNSEADSLAWLLYDPNTQCHTITAEMGLDAFTKKNLYVGLNDHYLDGEANTQIIFFRGNLGREMNFKKRFSSSFYNKTDGAMFINLKEFGSPGYLILFYRNASGKDPESLLLKNDSLIRDLLPALLRRKSQNKANQKKIQYSSQQIVYGFYRSLREISEAGKRNVHVIFIEPDIRTLHSSFPVFFQQGIDDLIALIQKQEKIFRVSSQRLAIILTVTDPEIIFSAIRELEGIWGFRAVMQVNEYPTQFNNIINYHFQNFSEDDQYSSPSRSKRDN